MRLLSRSEEMVLLAVWKLQAEAYCVPIQEYLNTITKKKWSFGSIFDPLERLERKRLLESSLTEPTSERGGRSKRVYLLTREGQKALVEIRGIQEAMWAGTQELQPEPEKS
jgi:PadR family transcriptional regulator PadR